MLRTESVGSITSKLGKVVIHEEQTKEELKEENAHLRDLLHEKVAELSVHQDTAQRLTLDSARWKFVKVKYYAQLEAQSPEALEKKVDEQMKIRAISRAK